MCLTTQVSSFAQKAKPGAINPNITPNIMSQEPKWLSKDRFWNLVFAFGMSIGLSASFATKDTVDTNFKLCSIIFYLTIIGMPFLVWYFNRTTFKAGKIFLNSEGRELDFDKDVPLAAFVLSIIFAVILGAFLDKYRAQMPDIIAETLIITSFCFLFSVFFIVKNCPIAILFNLEFRKMINATRTSSLSNDIVYDPAFKSSSCNIYHYRYRNR
jgi:hypothetical protein